MKNISFIITCFFLLSTHYVFAQAGKLDRTFGLDGKVRLPFGKQAEAKAVAIQTDGKIVLAGYSQYGTRQSSAVARLNMDGSPDDSFNKNGKVLTAIGDTSYAKAMALQSDGKIVVAGGAIINSHHGFVVVRYNSDGKLDNTFGQNGIAFISFGTGENHANGVAIQDDGKIVATGEYMLSPPYDKAIALTRLNTDGTLDKTFGSNDKIIINVTEGEDLANGIVIQPNGRIVVSGESNNETFTALRFKRNGELDSSFGNGGIVRTFHGYYYWVFPDGAVVLQPDGRIIVGGSAGLYYPAFITIRYKRDGSLDSGYGSNGILESYPHYESTATSLVIQTNGKIIQGGYAGPGFENRFALAQYNKNGTLDSSFGDNGYVLTDIGTAENYCNALALQADGKIVAAGGADVFQNFVFAVTRYFAEDVKSIAANKEYDNKEKTAIIETKIYPNPAKNILHVQTNARATVSLINATGKTVLTQTINGNAEINVANLPAGLYYLKNNETGVAQKVILK